MTSTGKRRRSQDRVGYAIIIICVVAFAGLCAVAAMADASHGISVAQSLQHWGL